MKLNALSRIARTACAFALSAAVALQGVPVQAFAAEQGDETAVASSALTEDPWYNYIDQMLAAGDYVEHRVLLAVSRDMIVQAQDGDGSGFHVEGLYETTGDQYELAFGHMLSEEVLHATDDALGVDDDLITSNDVPIKVLLVEHETMTTRELLEATAASEDPVVIGATPDYILDKIDYPTDEQVTTGDEAVEVGDDVEAQDADADADANATDADAEATDAETDIDLLTTDPNTRAAQPTSFTPAADATNITAGSNRSATSLQWGYDFKTQCFKGLAAGASLNESTFNSGAVNAGGVVAVFDTGVDFAHPDLKNSLFDMTPYLAKTGGGKYGYNALGTKGADPTNPADTVGHGTHVAGIIAAQSNGAGTSGIANGVKLIAVKGAGDDGRVTTSAMYAGYSYLTKVAQAGIDLRAINCSWTLSNTAVQASVRLAITDLANKYGVVTVFAAGNDSVDLDKQGINSTMSVVDQAILTVDSCNVDGSASAFSNYGKKTTTLFAPGGGILSTTRTTGHAQYLPTVMDHAVFETFAGTNALKAQGPTGNYLSASVNKNVSFDTQGGCMTLNTSQLAAAQSSNGFVSAQTRVILSIPLGNANTSQLSEVGLAVNLTGKATSKAWLEVAGGNNTWLGDNGSCNYVDSGSWHCLSLNLYEAATTKNSGGIRIYRDDSGNAYIKVAVCFDKKGFDDGASLKIDAVGLGNQCWNYGYMSGTSMAAPAISGLLAVYSYRMGNQYGGVAKTVRAQKLANILRKTVASKSGLANLCATGGYPDASKLAAAVAADKNTTYAGSASYSVSKTNSSYALCTISGVGFGDEQGTATISGLAEGTPVEVVSWSDDTIQLRIPHSNTAAKLTATVSTADGSTAKTGAISVLDTISQKDGGEQESGSSEQNEADGGAKTAGETTGAGATSRSARGNVPATGDASVCLPVFALVAAGCGLTLAGAAVAAGRKPRRRARD